MNNELTCAHCKKPILGSPIAVIVDAEEEVFCHEEHMRAFFKERDRIILEKVATQQQEAQ